MSNESNEKQRSAIEPRVTSVSSGSGVAISHTEVSPTVASQVSSDFQTASQDYMKAGNKTIQKRYATK